MAVIIYMVEFAQSEGAPEDVDIEFKIFADQKSAIKFAETFFESRNLPDRYPAFAKVCQYKLIDLEFKKEKTVLNLEGIRKICSP